MEWLNDGLWVWVVSPILVIAAAVFRIIFPVHRESEWNIRVGGHHDPVTGEFHGITHYFDREAVLTWYADCAECVADRDRSSLADGEWSDLYASVRGVQSVIEPAREVPDVPAPPA